MKLSLTDTETVHLLSILKERKRKYAKLAGLAEGRMKSSKFSRNAEKLMSQHKSKSEVAQGLIMKIAEQL